jgi:hypothetical protein
MWLRKREMLTLTKQGIEWQWTYFHSNEDSMESLQPIVQFVHSWLRWIFLLVALAAVGYFAIALAQRKSWDALGARLFSSFGWLIRIQWLIGLILFIIWGSMAGFGVRHQWEHLFAQTVALGVFEGMSRRVLRGENKFRSGLILLAVTLLIIFVGILSLPGVIQWRFFIPA